MLSRESLYLADEVFMSGTAAEITPVRSVDGIQVGEGRILPLSYMRIMHIHLSII